MSSSSNIKKTNHSIHYTNAMDLNMINDKTVDLVITSPPYPMVSMWDKIFGKQNNKIAQALNKNNGEKAFELMHQELDKVWNEVFRVLKFGGIACINIGDATRTIDKDFKLYPNHSRILQHFTKLGFSVLPSIIWRKQTNSPNKFMGSGTLPVGAYITLEHEYVLIFRKKRKREFTSEGDKLNRRQSSFFWEERNKWFSDVWFDIKGVKQEIAQKEMRKRSAAFPLALSYRLINMYSVKDDLVLDPFLGTGTTTVAAMASQRNSIGIEIDKKFNKIIPENIEDIVHISNKIIQRRLKEHTDFIENRKKEGKDFKYKNKHHNFEVVTKSEIDLILNKLRSFECVDDGNYEIFYD